MKHPILFLPGLLDDARLFGHQIAELSEIAEQTVADLTVADNIPDLARAAIAQMPSGPFAMAGMSMGGYVALEIMRQVPQRVTHLALLNTNARPDTPESTENRRRLMALSDRDFAAVREAMLPNLLHPDHLRDAQITGLVNAMAMDMGPAAFKRQQTAIIARVDSRPYLGAIRCPTLIVAGREDAIMPLPILEELANGIPGARLVVVGPSGHVSPLEQPEAVSAALYDWLQPPG